MKDFDSAEPLTVDETRMLFPGAVEGFSKLYNLNSVLSNQGREHGWGLQFAVTARDELLAKLMFRTLANFYEWNGEEWRQI